MMPARNPHTLSSRTLVLGAIVLGIQEYPLVATGSWVAELGILVPE
ncbi:MAG TPA: hypothetical protein VIE88_16260 [Vicinamibacteria bacterium]